MNLPEIADDAFTYTCHSDMQPATVIKRTMHTITTRDDNYRVHRGSTADGSAEYVYTSNPDGAVRTWRRNKQGRWVSKGYRGSEGRRRAYYNPHL